MNPGARGGSQEYQMKKRDYTVLRQGLVFFGVIFLLVFISAQIMQPNYAETRATVIACVEGDGTGSFLQTLQYQVGGVQYTVNRQSSMFVREGQMLTIRYDTNDPSRLVENNDLGRYVCLVTAIASFVGAAVMSRKEKQFA